MSSSSTTVMPFPAPPQQQPLNPVLVTVNVSNFISARLSGDKQANNYTLWREQMLCLIESQDLLRFIDGTLTVPPRRRRPILTVSDDAGKTARAAEDDRDDDNVVWTTDRLVKGWILGSINNSVLRTVVKLPTARQVWLELEKSFKTSEPPAPPPPPPLPRDVGLCLVDRDPTLTWQQDQNYCPLKMLSEDPSAFPSGRNFNFLQELIYSCVPTKLIEMPESLAMLMKSPQRHSTNPFQRTYQEFWKVLERLFPSMKDIRDQKVMHHHAPQLMKRLCSEISKCTDNRESNPIITGPFLDAARNGIDEMVKEILETFPQALYFIDDKKHSALHLAVMYRHPEVFKIFSQQIGEHKISMSITKDRWNNNILHSVGFRPKQDQLDDNSGPVLGMQRELQWYMKVEKFVTPLDRKARNTDGKTPLALFNERHSDLVAEETQWVTSMATASSVVASLIATIAFAAAITVPGGNDQNSGLPVFSSVGAFLAFAISDAIALLSSITTVLSFLSIFTSRYAVIDFLYTLPKRLIFGQTSLLVSVASLMVAFSCTLYLVVAQQNPVILPPLVVLASAPVVLFFFLQVPPLISMIKTTYGRSIFD